MFDVHGNVWELCSESSESSFPEREIEIRGGSWKSDAPRSRSDNYEDWGDASKGNEFGLRLALSPSTVEQNKRVHADAGQEITVNLAHNPVGRGFPKATASFTSPYDKVELAIDGRISYQISDNTRWTSYGSKNDAEWLAIDFGEGKNFSRVALAIYEDLGVKPPRDYRIEFWQDEAWKPVATLEVTPEKPIGGELNEIRFRPVAASKVRVVFTPQSKDIGIGVTEFIVWEK